MNPLNLDPTKNYLAEPQNVVVPEWRKGLGAFVDQTQALGNGLVALGAQAVGATDTRDQALQDYQRNMEESTAGWQAPAVGQIEDIKLTEPGGLSRLGSYLGYQVPMGLAQLGSLVIGGLGTGAVAKGLASKGIKELAKAEMKNVAADLATKGAAGLAAKTIATPLVERVAGQEAIKQLASRQMLGMGAGVAAGGFGMETGQTYGQFANDPAIGPEKAVLPSIAYGGIAGMLEYLPIHAGAKAIGLDRMLLRKVIKEDAGLAAKAVDLSLKQRALKAAGNIGVIALGGATAEGITEGLQGLVQQVAERYAKADPNWKDIVPRNQEEWSSIWNQAAAAAATGAVAGAALGPMTGKSQPRGKVRVPEAEAEATSGAGVPTGPQQPIGKAPTEAPAAAPGAARTAIEPTTTGVPPNVVPVPRGPEASAAVPSAPPVLEGAGEAPASTAEQPAGQPVGGKVQEGLTGFVPTHVGAAGEMLQETTSPGVFVGQDGIEVEDQYAIPIDAARGYVVKTTIPPQQAPAPMEVPDAQQVTGARAVYENVPRPGLQGGQEVQVPTKEGGRGILSGRQGKEGQPVEPIVAEPAPKKKVRTPKQAIIDKILPETTEPQPAVSEPVAPSPAQTISDVIIEQEEVRPTPELEEVARRVFALYQGGDLTASQYKALRMKLAENDAAGVMRIAEEVEREGRRPNVAFARAAGQVRASASLRDLVPLLGANMYKGAFVETAVKELAQNSFDAIKEESRKTGQTGKLDIFINYADRTVSVLDTGIGMNKQNIEDFFLKLGGTGKGGIGTSGGKGLAKVQFLYGAEWAELETTKDGTTYRIQATPEELYRSAEGKGIDVETMQNPGIPNGTRVTLKVPESYTDADGNSNYIYFPSNANSISFLEKPLLGDVEVSWYETYANNLDPSVRDTSSRVTKTTLPLGINFDPEARGLVLHSPAKTSWGDITLYIGQKMYGPQEKWKAKHPVLSDGIFQFDMELTTPDYEKVPFDILVDIKSKVSTKSAQYPFNNSREGFSTGVEEDVKALKNYLMKVVRGLQSQEVVKKFSDIKQLPRVDQVSGTKELSLEQKKKAAEAMKQFVEDLPPPPVEQYKPRLLLVTEGEVYDTLPNGKKKGESLASAKEEKKQEKSFSAEKAAPTAEDVVASGGFDKTKPLYHNNTNVDYIGEFGEEAIQLFAELGSITLNMIELAGEVGGFRYKRFKKGNKTNPVFGGISIDKGYRGLTLKSPTEAFFLNPLSVGEVQSLPGVVGSQYLTMLHEMAHFVSMKHNEDHTLQIHSLFEKFEDHGLGIDVKEQLGNVLYKHKALFNKMRARFEQSDTTNAGQSLSDGKEGDVVRMAGRGTGRVEDTGGPVSAGLREVGSEGMAGSPRMGSQPNRASIATDINAGAGGLARLESRTNAPTQSTTDFVAQTDSVLGQGWTQRAIDAGILEVHETSPADSASGYYEPATGKFVVNLDRTPEGQSPASVLLHEGSHAGMARMLGGQFRSFHADLERLATQDSETARLAVLQATQGAVTAINRQRERLGLETFPHRLGDETLPKSERGAELQRVRNLINDLNPSLLQEEDLAYYVQLASVRPPTEVGFWKRLLSAIQAWVAQTNFGKALAAIGWRPELSPQLAVELAKQAARATLRRAELVNQLVGERAKVLRSLPASAQLGLLEANVWHAGPTTWAPEPGFPRGRPRLDKVGTGEGGQMFGWGWYSAENEKVSGPEGQYAKSFANQVKERQLFYPLITYKGETFEAGPNIKFEDKTPEQLAVWALVNAHKSPRQAKADLRERYQAVRSSYTGTRYAELKPLVDAAVTAVDQIDLGGITTKEQPGAFVARLEIPDEDIQRMLQWEKPLSEQTPEVKAALRSKPRDNKSLPIMRALEEEENTLTGEGLYRRLTDYLGEVPGEHPKKKVSEYLRSLGIVGNKYLDQGSRRSTESPTYNYVVWDQSVLDRIGQQHLDWQTGERLESRQIDTAASLRFFDQVANIERTEGIEAAEENWIGGVADFGDPQAARDIQMMRGYFDYRGEIEDIARKELGNEFYVYRYGNTNEKALWEEYANNDTPLATTLNPAFANNFQKFAGFDDETDGGTRVVYRIKATPEAIVMIGHPQEQELVIALSLIPKEAVEIYNQIGTRLESRQIPISSSWWRSGVATAIASAQQQKAAPQQWLGWLKNQPGVKQEEIEDLGLEDWLNTQTKSVTKGEMERFVQEGGVRIEEVLKGAPTPEQQRELDHFDAVFNGIDDEMATIRYALPDGQLIAKLRRGEVDLADLDLPVQEAVQRYNNLRALRGDAEVRKQRYIEDNIGEEKFATYQVPGGENYRELLITVPQQGTTFAEIEDKLNGLGYSAYETDFGNWALQDEEGEGVALDTVSTEVLALFNQISGSGSAPIGPGQYASSHWNEPNVLVHIRFNERTDAEGKRVLFVEEVQSDWHQEGRKKGYRSTIGTNENWSTWASQNGISEEEAQLIWSNSTVGIGTPDPRFMRWNALREENRSNMVRAPSAPFKSAWPLLGMKRAIRWAAMNGFDKVAWTPGEVQAERYDLSKQVSRIEYADNGNNRYHIGAFGLDGQIAINETMDADKLETVVGKEIAQKIVNGEGTEEGAKQSGHKVLSGVDLKVGGEGMRGFYDKILPNELQKYVKKFGGKVGETRVLTQGGSIRPASQQITNPLPGWITKKEGDLYAVYDPSDMSDDGLMLTVGVGPTQEAALQNAVETYNTNYVLNTQPAWSLTLTPALRDEALSGQLLYSIPPLNTWPELSTWFTSPVSTYPEDFNKPGEFNKAAHALVDRFHYVKDKSPGLYRAFDEWKNRQGALQKEIERIYEVPLRHLVSRYKVEETDIEPIRRTEITNGKATPETQYTKVEVLGHQLAARHVLEDKVTEQLALRAAPEFLKELKKQLSPHNVGLLNADIKAATQGSTSIENLSNAEARHLFLNYLPSADPQSDIGDRWALYNRRSAGYSIATPGSTESLEDAVAGFINAHEIYTQQIANREIFQQITALTDQLAAHQLKMLQEGGLLTQAEVDNLSHAYPHFVPLRREAFDYGLELKEIFEKPRQSIGKLMTRDGSIEVPSAVHVLQNHLASGFTAASAAARNQMMNKFYDVVNADRTGWQPWFYFSDKRKNNGAMGLIRDGATVYIVPADGNLRAASIAKVIIGQDAQELSGPLKLMRTINNWIRWSNVSASPAFLLANAPRDYLTARYNLLATDAAEYAKEIGSWASYKESFKALYKVLVQGVRESTDPQEQAWIELVEDFEKAGGKTSFVEALRAMDGESWKSFEAQVGRREGKQRAVVEWGRDKLEWIENLNEAFENVMRLSTYKVMRDKVGKERAAEIARNLTTNFTRRGAHIDTINTWWLFYNATVQGNWQVIQNMFLNPNKAGQHRLQKAVAGTIIFAFMVDQLGRALSDDEDKDGISDWDSRTSWDKERKISSPFKVGGVYPSIPAPWVFNVFWRLGGMLGEVKDGVLKPQDAVMDSIGLTLTTMNPISGQTPAQFIAPSSFDPFMQIIENRDFMGNPLGPDGYPGASKRPDAYLAWDSTPEGFKSVAQFVNEVTGGSPVESGKVDLRPSSLKVLTDFALGGLGRSAMELLKLTSVPFTDEVDFGGPEKVPGAKVFLSAPSDSTAISLYHDRVAQVLGAKRLEKLYSEGNERNPTKLAEVQQSRAAVLRMVPQVEDTERQIKALRKSLRSAQAREDSRTEEQLRERIVQLQKRFNQSFSRRIGN